MNKYAIIENDKVTNIVVSTEEFAKSQGWILAPEEANIGWNYKNEIFSTNVEEKTEEEINNQAALSVRTQRDKLLQETDWVVIKAKETGTNLSASFKEYRQALRDITTQEGFPHNISWPEKP